jgi:hypothetical protein
MRIDGSLKAFMVDMLAVAGHGLGTSATSYWKKHNYAVVMYTDGRVQVKTIATCTLLFYRHLLLYQLILLSYHTSYIACVISMSFFFEANYCRGVPHSLLLVKEKVTTYVQ